MEKEGRMKNFHLGAFAVKKVKKVGLLRSGYAAGLLGGCFAISASSAILQRSLIADAMALRAPRCRLCAF